MACLAHNAKILRMSSANDRTKGRSRVLLEVAYKLYAGPVYTLCFHLLGSVEAAEEATVQVFAQFSRELPHRWNESLVRRQLRQLAIYEAVQRLRGRSDERLDGQAPKVAASPGMSVENKTNSESVDSKTEPRLLDSTIVNKLITRLPTDLRVAFVLHDMEGLSVKAIAQSLDLRDNDVRSLINCSRLELRRLWLSLR